MATRVTWNGDALIAQIQKKVDRGLKAMATDFRKMCVLRVSKANPGVSVRRTRNTKRGKKGSSYRIYPSSSKVGEAPRARTGLGRRSITMRKVADVHYQVGVLDVASYMSIHELSATKQRPWMKVTLDENIDHLRQLFAAYTK